jgi:hypothetical protein
LTLRDDLLPELDAIRQIPTDLGLRPTRVFVVVRTRTSSNALPSDTETEITPRPRLVQKQGGRTVELTPVSHTFTPAQLNPAPADRQTVLYRLSGEVTGYYEFETYLTGRPFRQTLVLRRLDRAQPYPNG